MVLAAAVTGAMVGGSIGEAHPTVHATAHQLAWLHTHQPGAAYALVAIAGASLVVRRRFPLAVLAVTVALVTAYSALGFVPGAALLSVFVALFTVGTANPRPVAITATAVSVLSLFLSAGFGGVFGLLGGTNSVMVTCCIAAVAIGLAVAGRRQLFVAMVERAERAERDREEEGRRRVDAERVRIARELHDVVAHSMSMINVQAGVAAHVLTTQPEEAATALAAIKDASREGLRELRAILNVLRQVDEDGPGGRNPAPRLAQLDALAAATTQAGVPTTVDIVGAGSVSVPAAVELAVYRIVQESLTNVMRHAGPDASAAVKVEIGPTSISVTVDDDGQGLSGSVFAEGTATGIAGMRERTAAFGGSLATGPKPGGGWQVRADLQLEAVAGDPSSGDRVDA